MTQTSGCDRALTRRGLGPQISGSRASGLGLSRLRLSRLGLSRLGLSRLGSRERTNLDSFCELRVKDGLPGFNHPKKDPHSQAGPRPRQGRYVNRKCQE